MKHKYLQGNKIYIYKYEIGREKHNYLKEKLEVAASLNPWSQAYKPTTGEVRTNSFMTKL